MVVFLYNGQGVWVYFVSGLVLPSICPVGQIWRPSVSMGMLVSVGVVLLVQCYSVHQLSATTSCRLGVQVQSCGCCLVS